MRKIPAFVHYIILIIANSEICHLCVFLSCLTVIGFTSSHFEQETLEGTVRLWRWQPRKPSASFKPSYNEVKSWGRSPVSAHCARTGWLAIWPERLLSKCYTSLTELVFPRSSLPFRCSLRTPWAESGVGCGESGVCGHHSCFCSPELLMGGALARNQLEVSDFKWPSKDRGLFEAE